MGTYRLETAEEEKKLGYIDRLQDDHELLM